MFDLFGPTMEDVQNVRKQQAINYLGLALLLIEKGVITDDELHRATIQATHLIDQGVAKRQEKVNREFDEEHPGVREILGKIFPQEE